jgi:hypothetical protein
MSLRPRQPETLVGQISGDDKPYPANPNWHHYAFDGDRPAAEKATGMKESY